MADIDLVPGTRQDVLLDNLVDPPKQKTGFARGLAVGVPQLKATVGGLAQYAGAATGIKGLERTGEEMVAAGTAAAEPNVLRVEDVYSEEKGLDAAKAAEFVPYTIGSQLPIMASMILGGVLGRGLGAIAGRGATNAAKVAAEKAAATGAPADIAAAQQAAVTAARSRNVGEAAGMGATAVGMEAGQIFPEALRTGVDDPLARTAAGALAAGALDTIVPNLIVQRLRAAMGKNAGAGLTPRAPGAGPIAGDIAKSGAKFGAIEGATEIAQTYIERLAAGQPLTDGDANSDVLNSAVSGVVMGGLTGGIAGGVQSLRRPVGQPDAQPAAQADQAPAPAAPTAVPVTPQPVPAAPFGLGVNAAMAQSAINDPVVPVSGVPDQRGPLAVEQPPAPPMGLEPMSTRAEGAWDRHNAIEAERDTASAQVRELTARMDALKTEKPTAGRTKAMIKAERERTRAALNEANAGVTTLNERLKAARATAEEQARIEAAAPKDDNTQPYDGPIVPTAWMEGFKPAPADAPAFPPAETLGAGMQQELPLDAPPAPRRTFESVLFDIERDRIEALKPIVFDSWFAKREQEKKRREQSGEAAVAETPGQIAAAFEAARVAQQERVAQEARRQEEVAAAKTAEVTRQEAVAPPTLEEVRSLQQLNDGKPVTPEVQAQLVQRGFATVNPDGRARLTKEGFAARKSLLRKAGVPTTAVQASLQSEAMALEEGVSAAVALSDAKLSARRGMTPEKQALKRDETVAAVREVVTGAYKALADGKLPSKAVVLSRLQTGLAKVPGFDKMQSRDVANEVIKTVTYGPMFSKASLVPEITSAEFEGLSPEDKAVVVDRRDAILAAKGEALLAHFKQLIGPDANLEVKLFQAEPGSPIGSYTRTGPLKSVVSLAVNAKDGKSVADHEGYHYLEDQVLDGRERQVIANALKPGKQMYRDLLTKANAYDQVNGTSVASEIVSSPAEARAYGFEFWRRGELQADSTLGRAWAKIKDFVERTANFIRGQGFTSVEDIFSAMDRGQFAERQRNSQNQVFVNGVAFDPAELGLQSKAATNTVFSPALQAEIDYQQSIETDDGEPTPLPVVMKQLIQDMDDFDGTAREFRRELQDFGIQQGVFQPYTKAQLDNVQVSGNRKKYDFKRGEIYYRFESWAPLEAKTLLSKGAIETPEFKKWFGDSKVVDAEGKPLVVYRGEHGATSDGDLQTLLGTYTFTDSPNVASLYAESPNVSRMTAEAARVIPAYITIKKPIFENRDDPFVDMSDLIKKIGKPIVLRLAEKHSAAIENTSNWDENFASDYSSVRDLIKKAPDKVGGLYMDAYPLLDDHQFVVAAKDAGFDGAIHIGNGESSDALEYRVFNKEQIKSAIGNRGTFDPSNPNILYSKGAVASGADKQSMADRASGAQSNSTGLEPTTPSGSREEIGISRSAALTNTALSEIVRRMKAGELTREQAFSSVASLLDSSESRPVPPMARAKAAANDLVGRFTRARHYLATQNYIARDSKGFKNVLNTLSIQEMYKNTLVEDGSKAQLAKWHDANQADRDAAFNVMLKRRVGGFQVGSKEYNELMAPLSAGQRTLAQDADKMIANFLRKEFEAESEDFRTLLPEDKWNEWKIQRSAQVESLIKDGYVPFDRFGDHTVRMVVDLPEGKTATVAYYQFGTKYEADIEAKKFADEIKASGAEIRVEVGHRYKAEFDHDLSVRQVLDTLRRTGVPLQSAEKERIARLLLSADSMRRQRMLRAKKVPGFSHDGFRVLNKFVVGMSGRIAHARFSQAVNDSLDGVPVDARLEVINDPATRQQSSVPVISKEEGRNLWTEDGPTSGYYRNLANDRANIVLSPEDTAVWSTRLKAAAMTYFIGGSISSGMVQMVAVPMNTLPYLSQYTNYANAFSSTLSAWGYTLKNAGTLRDINKLSDAAVKIPDMDDGLRSALIQATRDGTVSSTEVHQIMGISRGGLLSQSKRVQKALDIWMAPFKYGEGTSRVASFIAAYKLGREGVNMNPDGTVAAEPRVLEGYELYNFARSVVDNTQNRFDPVNRPLMANHPIGSLLFMFKSFPLFVVEMIETMYKTNPKAAAFMLLGMVAMTGVQGLPFAEDILDLVDTISQKLFNSPFQARRAMRNVLKDATEAIVGVDKSDLILRGMVNDLTGYNIATRVGNGDIIPGTRMGTADMDYGRAAEQILGAPMSMLIAAGGQVDNFAGSLLKGDLDGLLASLRAGGPVAVRNLIKGMEQTSDGFSKDAQGRKLADVSGMDAFWQSIGLSSAALTKLYDLDSMERQRSSFYKQAQTNLNQQIVRAVRDGKTEKIAELYDAAQKWNEANPEMPIALHPAEVRRGIVTAGLPLNERTLKLLPRNLRGSSIYAEQ